MAGSDETWRGSAPRFDRVAGALTRLPDTQIRGLGLLALLLVLLAAARLWLAR